MNKLQSMLKKVSLETLHDINALPFGERSVGVSDMALANGVSASSGNDPTCLSVLASCSSGTSVYYVDSDGCYFDYSPRCTDSGIVPALTFNLPSDISARSASAEDLFGCDISVGEVKYLGADGKKGTYHTITFANTRGFSKKVDSGLSKKLNKALKSGTLEKSSLQITGRMNEDKTFKKFDVFIYEGKEYAYVEAKSHYGRRKQYLDGTPIIDGEMIFVELKPATLRIRTEWKDLPKCINPEGTGNATELVVRMENAVTGGIPFCQDGCTEYDGKNCDVRRYVENDFVQEFFVDVEQENNKGATDLNKALAAITAGKSALLKKIQRLESLDAALFEKDSESMNLIAEDITSYIAKECDKLYSRASSNDAISEVAKQIEEILAEYKRIVTTKRAEYKEIKTITTRDAAAAKTKAALTDLKKFKHQKFPQGERVHMDRHSFHSEEQE